MTATLAPAGNSPVQGVNSVGLPQYQGSVPFGGLTQGAQVLTSGGTVTVNGTAAITVSDTGVTANSIIVFTLKTVGGNVGAQPAISTITPGTGFTVVATTSDTSVYNWARFG